jgi:hypothetical protein
MNPLEWATEELKKKALRSPHIYSSLQAKKKPSKI